MVIKNIIIIGVVAGTILACSSKHVVTLRNLEPLLVASENVDSCLNEIRTIDTLLLSKAGKAKYSVLHAMALDKSYIDTTDCSIILPAVNYYNNWYRFSKKDKFYSNYYYGRILENRKEYEDALAALLKAERYVKYVAPVYGARLYFSFERIYQATISFKEALEASKRALNYSIQANDPYNIGTALTDCSIHASLSGQKDIAGAFLSEFKRICSDSLQLAAKYYLAKMAFYYSFGPKDSLLLSLDNYIEYNTTYPDYLICSLVAIKGGDYDKACSFLDRHCESTDSGELSPLLSYCSSLINEKAGKYREALEDYRMVTSKIDIKYLYNLDNSISSVYELYHRDLDKQRIVLLFVILMSALLIIVLLMTKYNQKKRYENVYLKSSYREIKKEYDVLRASIKARGNADTKTKDNIKKVLARMGEIATELTGVEKRHNLDIALVFSRNMSLDEFCGLVSMLGFRYAGNFCLFLMKKELNPLEEAYCVLLMNGFLTKELKSILGRGGLYNVNSTIKTKLGVNSNADIHHILMNLYVVCND